MELESRTVRRLSLRLVPLLALCYFVAYLDRVNVGFAALTMNKQIGLSASAFGFGAGIFFFTYFIFEVPSNLALERFGARKWIARIMLSWGVLSAATAFVTGPNGFYAVRLLLGAAEAGFFPGIVFYLTLWFPSTYRGRIIGYFMAAIPLSSVIGAPVSGLALGLDGLAGFHGWQWLFFIESVPTLVLAVVVLFALPDRPEEASFLAADERGWLIDRLARERAQRETARRYSVMQALVDPKVLMLSLVYFGDVAMLYGVGFFLPQIVKAFGLSNAETGFVTAIPYLVGTITMIWWSRRSDRTRERKGHTAVALLAAAGGLALSTAVADPMGKVLCLMVSSFGIFSCLPVFWTLPTAFLSGAPAAAGIAVVNAIGNLSGFVGPFVVGWLKDRTGGFAAGLLVIAACGIVGMVIVLALGHDTRLEAVPERLPGRSEA